MKSRFFQIHINTLKYILCAKMNILYDHYQFTRRYTSLYVKTVRGYHTEENLHVFSNEIRNKKRVIEHYHADYH